MQTNPVVFLVDDDPAILLALSRALRRYGLEVEPYGSATEFLEAYSDKSSCLVLDLSMPEMSGLELQQELLVREIKLPIIFITGQGGVPESVKALRAGAIDFLEKPFLSEVLLERIDEAIALDSKARSITLAQDQIRARFARLTGRERDVFHLFNRDGEIPSSKEMARSLGISHRTVEHHRSRMLEKTKTKSVSELRSLAKQVGIQQLLQ